MNWQAASGAAPVVGVKNGVDPSGSKSIAQMASVVSRDPSWYEFTLANNLPYANVIEYGGSPGDGPNTVGGFSKQAPQGVVRVNVLRFQQLIDEEAAKVR